MEEIAATFGAAGLPEGFHRAAAEIYARSPHAGAETHAGTEAHAGTDRAGSAGPLAAVLAALLSREVT
jgi:hypothetical protein